MANEYTPVLSSITLPSGGKYYFKDAYAREQLENLVNYTKYLGVTTTQLSDGDSTNPIIINGESVTATTGNIVIYGDKEFIFNGQQWQEFGDLSALINQLGNFAYVSSVSTDYTPEGTVSGEFSGTEGNISVTGAISGNIDASFEADAVTVSINYTPSGNITATFSGNQDNISVSGVPTGIVQMAEILASADGNYVPVGTVSVVLDKTTGTVNSITGVGTSATFGLNTSVSLATVISENLILHWGADLFNFTPNALPTYSAVSVLTDVSVSSATFSGQKVLISATFSGSSTTFTGTYTPSGIITNGTFSGTSTVLSSTFTPTGTISGTFTSSATLSGTYTPSGSLTGLGFSGSSATITVSAPAHSS